MQDTNETYLDSQQVEAALEAALEFVQTPVGMISAGSALLVFVLASCRIFAKAGFRAGLGVAMLIPGVNVLLFAALAFLPWPVLREAKQLRKMQKAVHKADARHQKKNAA